MVFLPGRRKCEAHEARANIQKGRQKTQLMNNIMAYEKMTKHIDITII